MRRMPPPLSPSAAPCPRNCAPDGDGAWKSKFDMSSLSSYSHVEHSSSAWSRWSSRPSNPPCCCCCCCMPSTIDADAWLCPQSYELFRGIDECWPGNLPADAAAAAADTATSSPTSGSAPFRGRVPLLLPDLRAPDVFAPPRLPFGGLASAGIFVLPLVPPLASFSLALALAFAASAAAAALSGLLTLAKRPLIRGRLSASVFRQA
mmetsp:Transcript_6210/g.24898  ORF Transcript_6210/g.24898 Transcript_6210/m.24898 type:complete len:206 (-) Transcript_6210:90-707(-)